jgi:hypothetical protein
MEILRLISVIPLPLPPESPFINVQNTRSIQRTWIHSLNPDSHDNMVNKQQIRNNRKEVVVDKSETISEHGQIKGTRECLQSISPCSS